MDIQTDMWYFNVKWDHKWNNFLGNCLIHMANFKQKVNNVLHLEEYRDILYHVTSSIRNNLNCVDLI